MIVRFRTVLVFFIFASIIHAHAQTQEEMDTWQEYMTPSEQHQWLKSMCGEWSAEITMWMAPGAEPIQYPGTASAKMILGDRYQETIFLGTFMGQPFEGKSITGFDKAKKVYFSTWIDNMGTGLMYTEGTYDEETNTLTQTGETIDPSGKRVDVREVTHFSSSTDEYTFEMYMTKDGVEFQTMLINYRKAK